MTHLWRYVTCLPAEMKEDCIQTHICAPPSQIMAQHLNSLLMLIEITFMLAMWTSGCGGGFHQVETMWGRIRAFWLITNKMFSQRGLLGLKRVCHSLWNLSFSVQRCVICSAPTWTRSCNHQIKAGGFLCPLSASGLDWLLLIWFVRECAVIYRGCQLHHNRRLAWRLLFSLIKSSQNWFKGGKETEF